jgi:SAM-dependent methyltransferase
MRTFITGMAFMAVLAAAVFRIITWSGVEIPDAPPGQGLVQTATPPPSLAPYEPSPREVVAEMVNIAALTRDDVVFDLGSGDGRVLITAARKAGARCVGIEMDHRLIEESRAQAEREKVSHLVQFREEDIVRADIADASVVMLFLSREANAELRPRLLRELEPGSRVVSHCHDMGDWEPDRTSTVGDHQVYAWIVPAEVDGAWKMEMPARRGEAPRLVFLQQYQRVTAWVHVGRTTIAASDAQLRGKQLTFTVNADIGALAGPADFTAEVEGGVMKGSFRTAERAGTWKAVRQ